MNKSVEASKDRHPFTISIDSYFLRSVSMRDRLNNTFRFVKYNLVTLNLFQSIPRATDQNILRQQRYITRIYLLLLAASVMTIIISTSITGQTIYFNVDSPTLKDFLRLSRHYASSLTCPCTQTAIDQRLLSFIEPRFHEICSSGYVSPAWINLRFENVSSPIRYTRDVRHHWQTHFQLISTLCQMADMTMEDALRSFYRTKFVTTHMLSIRSFETQMELIMAHFKRTVPQSFQRTLALIKTNFEINQFITPINAEFALIKGNTIDILLSFLIHFWRGEIGCTASADENESECICISTSLKTCYRSIVIYGNEARTPIPGMFQTWFPLQSVLLSTLECLFNNTCLSHVRRIIHPAVVSSINFTTLKSSASSSDIDDLAENMFIESWNNRTSFDSYFKQCRPNTCQYNVHTRLNLVYVATRILGLIGGINVVLGILLPVLVKLILRFKGQTQGTDAEAVRSSRCK